MTSEKKGDQTAAADSAPVLKPAHAVLVPHAGWQYSGRLAAQTLKQIKIPHRAVIFAPQHRGGGADWAVAPYRIWQLPGKNVEADWTFSETMTAAVDFFTFDEVPHAREHAVEVLLPILARLAPQTLISAVAMSVSPWEMIRQGAAQFAAFLDTLPECPLLIISSDMNHFADDVLTRRADRTALQAIADAAEMQKPEHALRVIYAEQISMCGIVPAVFVMETLRLLDRLRKPEETGYATSAEASGDTNRVVGYAGLIF
jgi:AmmeMemoRadiSam system protein B